jgi:hypothetical protein
VAFETTAPDESLTTPEIELWANNAAGTKTNAAAAIDNLAILIFFNLSLGLRLNLPGGGSKSTNQAAQTLPLPEQLFA